MITPPSPFPLPQAQVTSVLLSVAAVLTTLGTWYEWNHVTCGLSCLAYSNSTFSRFIHMAAWIRIPFFKAFVDLLSH